MFTKSINTCIINIVLGSFIFFSGMQLSAQNNVIIDADTGNEVDDFYALARVFLEPSVNITALNAAHWQTSHWAIENTMENSHRLNQQLLGEMGLSIKTNRGAMARMYDWGERAQHSAAAYEIIKQAQESEKVQILVLGALTNVASAVYIAPSIAEKLEVYWLGTTVDFERGILKRNDFNPLMDPYALDYLLDSKVSMKIMPVSIAVKMEIDFDELNNKIGDHFLGAFLMDRWITHLDGSRRSRVLWDLALITAFIKPEMASTKQLITSKDSGNREITFYDGIDADAIYEDFCKTLLAFEKE
ncbi:nucleoside hydrolase [Flagellimonas sp. CMM7]|uniref:nucleoside hydrolase n=1 Tax=Flagellimonas sp. CMM7 TaxID=2654676 RepID=UPI0013D72097|nr:nucleoside hydrolase [Flagellimonas sp. CMM7]UII79412.1 nucleoside hydrolase [Flagellimonas sp. CMM7]